MARVSRKNKGNLQNVGNMEPKNNVFYTAIYTRLSREDIYHKINNQEQVIRNYLKDKPNFQIVKLYCDNGYTGTNFERDSFIEMMEDAKKGKINCIVIKDLSRLGRNYLETEQYITSIFPFLGVRLIAVNENFDSFNKDNDMMISLKNIVNDAYAKDISRKIFSAKEAQRIKGEFVGNIPPYGYNKSELDSHKLVINDETGYIIQRIFSLKEQKKTNTEIAKILNSEEVIAPMKYWYLKGKVHHEKYASTKWEATTIKVILQNQMYTGDMVQGKKQKCIAEGRTKVKAQSKDEYVIVPDTHEALIERSLFDRVQMICEEEIQLNREKRNKNKNMALSKNLLENKIKSKDGLKMYRKRNVYENRVTYNFTTAKVKKVDGTPYPSCYISEKNVFKALKSALYEYIEQLFSINEMLENPNVMSKINAEQKDNEDKKAALKRDIERFNDRLANLYTDMAEGIITLEEYNDLKEEFSENNRQVKKELETLEEKESAHQVMPFQNTMLIKKYQKFLKEQELTEEIIDLLVKEIIVFERAKIKVVFAFEDEVKKTKSYTKVANYATKE